MTVVFQKERLEMVLEEFKKLPVEDFNLARWRYDFNPESPKKSSDNICGTTYCVIGHCASQPEFNRLGLWLEKYTEGGAPEYGLRYDCGDHKYGAWIAVTQFLGIDWSTAQYMFASDEYEAKGYSTPRKDLVMARIKKIIHQNGRELGQWKYECQLAYVRIPGDVVEARAGRLEIDFVDRLVVKFHRVDNGETCLIVNVETAFSRFEQADPGEKPTLYAC